MNLSALRILIVEDNRQIVELVRTILAAVEARDVDIAAGPGEAWDRLAARAYDLLIVDRSFEDEDGLDLVRRVRSPSLGPAAFQPILMLTASAERSVVAAARDAGVTEYLVKPFSAAALLDRIHTMIERPRPFVQSADYFGPDRRRRSFGYRGVERRSA